MWGRDLSLCLAHVFSRINDGRRRKAVRLSGGIFLGHIVDPGACPTNRVVWISTPASRPHGRAGVYFAAVDERRRIRLTKYSTKTS
jgi:hypothetical protein